MKKAALLVVCAFALAFLTVSCSKEKPAPPPPPAAQAPDISQALMQQANRLAEVQKTLDSLIGAVVPDKQQKALIIARENVEKLALVVTYEAKRRGEAREMGLGLIERYRKAMAAVMPDIFNEEGLALCRRADAAAAEAVKILG
ncbi:MAG: hypothetical protein AB1921_02735 [Thermodesulfobacteriota bacterium]